MKTIRIDDEVFQLKTSFKEMEWKEISVILSLQAKFMTTEIPVIEFNAMRITIFRLLTNIKPDYFNKITASQFSDLLPHVDFALNEVPDFDENELIQLHTPIGTLFGPQGLMDKSSVEEFIYCDSALIQVANMKNTEAMLKMLCYIYRPKRADFQQFFHSKDWNGDIREPFNIERCNQRLATLKETDLVYQIYAYQYFRSVRKQKFEKFKYLFKKMESTIHLDDRGWPGAMLELSHTGVFGKIEEQMKQNWFTVMFEMDRLAEISYKKQENEHKSRP
jgi:hypothetical protein